MSAACSKAPRISRKPWSRPAPPPAVPRGHVAPQAALDEPEFPPERDVAGEAPRIGVFICDCGESIGGVIDVPELAAFARPLPGVVLAEGIGHGCSRESLKHIEEAIESQQLNRVVIGGCSPRTHETRFQDVLRRAGLNRYLVEIANLRDQDTWVHPDQPEAAETKARQLIWAAILAVKRARPLPENWLPINRDVLVLGGGVAGMTAALRLADQGIKVFLAERRSMLGGVANLVHRTLEGRDVQALVRDLIQQTTTHANIQVITNAFIVDHSGMPGSVQDRHAGGPADVLPADQPRGHHPGHRRAAQSTGRIPARPSSGRHDPVGCGRPVGRNAFPDRALAGGGHDPVRGLPAAGQPQLFPGLLPDGHQKRPAHSGKKSRGSNLDPLSGHAHLRFPGRLLPAGPGKGGHLCAL